ncbi:membrane protein [Mesorhizobium sp. LSHC424B00]|nr:rhomboid family intramembrane serine protease [Mesorhizobium sp. LSHC424B00]ESX56651.1 membrane protein [Mesorhizobium sp. LSHC424B00]
MFIPLYDSNRLRHIRLQYVTIGLIAANALVFLITTIGGENFNNAAVLGLGFIPSVVHDTAELSPQFVVIPESLSYLTYAFLHADIIHLGGNMLFLWVFGDNVEDALGHIRYLIFYLLCAIAGAFFQGLVAWSSEVPLIGAAGGENQISWACHIGGIIAGGVLVLIMRSRGVPLLAGDDGEPEPADQPAASTGPAPAGPAPVQPETRWGRGGASGHN